jgi:hypothetical protein
MKDRAILTGWLPRLASALVACLAFGGGSPPALVFEEAVQRSDRIVIATVEGVGAGTVTLPSGAEIALGIKDGTTGLVFTPYRVRITACLLDDDASCRPGDGEVFVPGGTVYEIVEGERRLRTWELPGAASAPLPPVGKDVLLFMTQSHGRFQPLNDRGGRVPVDRSANAASVTLRFDSPRFLTDEGRESARARARGGNPATTRPAFVESVPVDRLKALVALARAVPTPTSGNRHAISGFARGLDSDVARESGVGLCAGEDSERHQSPLGVGDDRGETDRTDERRRACGP